MEDLSFLDRIRTELRLFLMGNRELIVLLGIVVLAASVIYSTKIISLPTRVPTRATVVTPTPTPFPKLTPASGGFLELLEISPVLPTVLTPSPTPFAPEETIFLPPILR